MGFRKAEEEELVILETAERFGIDARLLAALRETENGGPGREFGVLSVEAPTFREQAEVAARTISRTLERFRQETGLEPLGTDGRVTESWLRYFSWGQLPDGRRSERYPGYAPLGAANDPSGLNAHHFPNLAAYYAAIEVA